MYFISRYDGNYRRSLPQNVTELDYLTAAGRQVAFYLAPGLEPARPPDRLWILFGGNGSVALGWLKVLRGASDLRAGYLLLDYPGCGLCQGRPGRDSIRDTSEQALTALAARLRLAPSVFEGRLSLVGHSLGSAAALEMAPRHRVERVVLLAPFTSMMAIAEHIVGWPFCQFVPDRFDNEARLRELHRAQPRCAVTIIHGARDTVVPVAMGRTLAGLVPGWVRYEELPQGTHMSVVDGDQEALRHAMAAPWSRHDAIRDRCGPPRVI